MNARDRIAAVVMVIGTPWNGAGIAVIAFQLASHTGEDNHCKQETDAGAERVNQMPDRSYIPRRCC